MDLEKIHQEVEEYLTTIIPEDLLSSLTPNNARDFSKENAPYLSEGTEPFIVFDVKIGNTEPASVGNTASRATGVINIETSRNRQGSIRDSYKMLNRVLHHITRINHNGIRFRDITSNGDYESGNWIVDSYTVPFNVTRMI